jgi:hypothetical protein
MAAIADAGLALGDIWSLNVNQAGILAVKKINVAVDHQKTYLNQQIAASRINFVMPFKGQVLGMGLATYGFDAYKQQELLLSYARAFGPNLSAALAVHYHQLSIQSYGKSAAYSIDAGFIYKMNAELSLGVHISNVTNHSFDRNLSFMALPMRMQVGMAYRASQQVVLSGTLEQSIHTKPEGKLGIDYQIINQLFLRAGMKTNPIRECAGMGLVLRAFHLDIAFTTHPFLGTGSQIGLSYEF